MEMNEMSEPILTPRPKVVTLLVAWDDNRLIGKRNGLPWRNPHDLKLFQQRTLGNTVIFGRTTYLGLPVRPLKGRVNVVVALPWEEVEVPTSAPRNTVFSVASGIKEAIEYSCMNHPKNEIFICGGASIYKQSLEQELVSRMLVSVIPGEHEGDIFFPEFPGVWARVLYEQYDDFLVEEWTLDQK